MPELKQEQIKIINHQSGNILVSASAGSGKTFVMIERVIRLITENKAKVSEILAVTFTEAAATEMKERLKKALSDKINDGREDLSFQLNDVASSDISTMHSFCARLIRLYFFVAGVSPDFKIIDAVEATNLKNRSIAKVMREKYTENSEQFNSFLDKFIKKRSDASLRETVLSLYEFANVEADPESIYDLYKNSYTVDGYIKLCSEYKDFLDKELSLLKQSALCVYDGFKSLKLNKSAEFCLSMIDDIDLVLNGDLYCVKQYESYAKRLSFESGLSGDALDFKMRATEIRDRLKVLFKNFSKDITTKDEDLKKLPLLSEITEQLVSLVRSFSNTYSELKKEENVLDFNDLEHFALKVLSDNGVREAVRQKYKFVFVDEYQDTNGVQEAIIEKVSNNNLFMVGDVKQSIYGFRGCRPDIFANKMKTMQSSGQETAVLNYNFRSADKVIDCVNEIFSFCMKQDNFGEDYEKNSKLKAGGIYGNENPGRATLHLLLKNGAKITEKERPRVYDILQEIKDQSNEEAESISFLIASIIKDELGKTYYDPKSQTHKRVTLNDIVILTRNRTNAYVQGLVDGLTRLGVGIQSEIKQKVCLNPEIQVLINALRLIYCFKQDIPLGIVLQSPIGGFTEEELAEIVLFYTDRGGKGGFYDAYECFLNNASGDLHQKVKHFDGYFEKVRYLSDFIGAKGVLEKLIEDSDYNTYILAERLGDIKLKRIRRFLAFTENNGKLLTVSEMLDMIDNRSEAFDMTFNSDEEAVRIMTIHASKGLEFPVVIVCGLERKMNTEEEKEEVLTDREKGFAVKYYDDSSRTYSGTLLRSVIRERMREMRVKEEMRLFYVATTRATYSLHLTFEGEDSRCTSFNNAQRLLDYVPKDMHLQIHNPEDFDFISLRKDTKTVIIGKHDQILSEKMKKDFEFVYPHLPDTVLPLKSNVTEVVKSAYVKGNKNREYTHFGQTDETKGTCAHKFLEFLDFNKTEDLTQEKKRMIKLGLMTEKEFSEFNLSGIEKALKTQAFSGIFNKEIYKEKSFIVNVPAKLILETESEENVLLQGVIDLLTVCGDTAQIFDYKYSQLDGESLREKYQKQLDLYAYAVEKVLNKKVTDKFIVNIYSGDVVKIN